MVAIKDPKRSLRIRAGSRRPRKGEFHQEQLSPGNREGDWRQRSERGCGAPHQD